MIEKQNAAIPGLTRCDACPDLAECFVKLGAYCLDCYTRLVQDKKEEFMKLGEDYGYPVELLEQAVKDK